MLRTSARSYVCWQCAVRRAAPDVVSNPAARTLPRANASPWRRAMATVQHPPASGNGSDVDMRAQGKGRGKEKEKEKEKKIPVRERLRAWNEENRDQVETILADFAGSGELSNSITRPQNVSMGDFEVSAPLFDGDELGDLRSDDATLRAGDMVELSSEGSRRPMLAICLGRFNGYEYYYTSSGKWFIGLGVKTLFVVHKFATQAEIEGVLTELPTKETPLQALNALQDLGHSPSRIAGAALLRKMLNFVHESESVYQANAGTLDASSSFIGDPVKHRYLTLHEIAELLLPETYQINGKFEPNALYAVHRALLQDEVFFRPLRQTGHKRSYVFEISPLSEVRIVQKTEGLVREYMESMEQSRGSEGDKQSPLHVFIRKARKLIDQSRKIRPWTKSGIIGPSMAAKSEPAQVTHEWSETDKDIIQFIELWASYQKFPSYSRLQCFGSAIMRALDRYRDAESLSSSTGWTFLQEIGWVPSWEIPARYNIRFPGVEIKRGAGYIRPDFGDLDSHLKEDVMASMRKTWDLTAYCIDSEITVDIDDAVSLEPTSDPNQFWIHVHVADPASAIHAETPIAKFAELMPETIYLPGHFERMLPISIGQDRFSLGANRPCLTFSSLVDRDGIVLEDKVTPGILKNVVYMTNKSIAEVLGEYRDDPVVGEGEMILGPMPDPKTADRPMTQAEDLSSSQRDEVKLMSELGRAIHAQRLSKGATPFFQSSPEARAYFSHLPEQEYDNFISSTGDPSIRVAFSKRNETDLVENVMRLAGETAARWCYERGIPIPFRAQPHAQLEAAAVREYTREVFYPLLKAGLRPSDHHWRHLRALIGTDEITTTASPHFTLGADMYTKATSPLRRFSDLIVHWQVEAALLEEQRRGASLVGNKDDSFLPFNRERLDRLLPMLRVREKQARSLARGDGGDQWILQALVRAWRFGEAKIPEKFRFSVVHIHNRRSVQGRLDWFDRPALLMPEYLNNVVRLADIRVGDVYEVKIRNVNVHANKIWVEAVGTVKQVGPANLTIPEGERGVEAQV